MVLVRYQMFTQVYFQKSRRVYDYHLKEALHSLLPKGKLPTPQKIENFLKSDDFHIWYLMKKSNENPHCKAILEQKHIKLVYSIPGIPHEEDELKFEKKRIF